MQIHATQQPSLWYDEVSATLRIIDQTRLPFEFRVVDLHDVDAVCEAIVTGLVTDQGIFPATPTGLAELKRKLDQLCENSLV